MISLAQRAGSDVYLWRKADTLIALNNVRLWGQSGRAGDAGRTRTCNLPRPPENKDALSPLELQRRHDLHHRLWRRKGEPLPCRLRLLITSRF